MYHIKHNWFKSESDKFSDTLLNESLKHSLRSPTPPKHSHVFCISTPTWYNPGEMKSTRDILHRGNNMFSISSHMIRLGNLTMVSQPIDLG